MTRVSAFALALAGFLLFSVSASPAAPGSLDSSFGTGGKVTTPIRGHSIAHAVAIQRDGRIVAAGLSSKDPSKGYRWAFARYNRDGSLDRRFGRGGRKTLAFRSGSGVEAVGLQRDGKIIATGVGARGFRLTRLTRSGRIDRSFGTRGQAITQFPSGANAHALAVQPDGKIVVAGDAGAGFGLVRYKPNGSPDRAFGTNGRVETPFELTARAASIALQRDRKILVAGFLEASGYAGFAVARYLPDGRPDSSFGTEGRVVTQIGTGSGAFSVTVQPDGKIVAGGLTYEGDGPFSHFAVVRYHANGRLDDAFGKEGIVTTRVSRDDWIAGVAIDPHGKLLAAGCSWQDNYGFALVRYNPAGGVDYGFGHRGKQQLHFGGLEDLAYALAVQPDGKVVVGGTAQNRSNNRFEFALARYRAR